SLLLFFFSSRRRHTRFSRDWSSDVCSSDLLIFTPNKHRKKGYQKIERYLLYQSLVSQSLTSIGRILNISNCIVFNAIRWRHFIRLSLISLTIIHPCSSLKNL